MYQASDLWLRPIEPSPKDKEIQRLKKGAKKQHHDSYGIGGIFNDDDNSYDEKYDRYIRKTIPGFVASFSDKFEMLYNQRLLKVRITNSGQIRADHLVVSVSTNDGWLNKVVIMVSPLCLSPPMPPRPFLAAPPDASPESPARTGTPDRRRSNFTNFTNFTNFAWPPARARYARCS